MAHKRKDQRTTRPGRPPQARDGTKSGWIYGAHAVLAALSNESRRIRRIVASEAAAEALPDPADPRVEHATARDIAALLPEGAVHQGLACLADPLPEPDFGAICDAVSAAETALVVVLDRVTDPQNVGAVLRSSAAFGADAVIAPDRHAPEPSGALAKAASGALERIPYCRVTNLVRALEMLKSAGLWCYGLDPDGGEKLSRADLPAKCCFVLGAEGPGLRRLTTEHCDGLLSVPIGGAVESLNVSNTAAIALYAYRSAHGIDPGRGASSLAEPAVSG